jgi:hypothetical protein
MGDIEQRSGASAPDLLAHHEAVIERGLETFVEVGQALMAIRDGRLYKATHLSFDDYCDQRWGFSRVQSTHLIGAAQTVTMVTTFDAPPPANERQARALAPLRDDPEAMAEVMVEVTDAAEAAETKVTAKSISDAVTRKLQELHDMSAELDAARAEVGRLNALAPDDFDPALNSRLISERGQLVRVCNELLGMGDPAELFDRQRNELREHHRKAVQDAATWLTFLNKVMEDR